MSVIGNVLGAIDPRKKRTWIVAGVTTGICAAFAIASTGPGAGIVTAAFKAVTTEGGEAIAAVASFAGKALYHGIPEVGAGIKSFALKLASPAPGA